MLFWHYACRVAIVGDTLMILLVNGAIESCRPRPSLLILLRNDVGCLKSRGLATCFLSCERSMMLFIQLEPYSANSWVQSAGQDLQQGYLLYLQVLTHEERRRTS